MENLGLDRLTEIYGKRNVLITGATGFKGSWLTFWLKKMGANVSGLGLEPATSRSLYSELDYNKDKSIVILDILDKNSIDLFIKEKKPEIIFHLAAQPLVSVSYDDPADTFMTNIIGLVNLFESLRNSCSVKAAVIVTSDKCYSTETLKKKFAESDPLGGHDPYSASKACAEIVSKSYYKSFFSDDRISFVTVRAGNIIGGGDWSKDRLIPDIVKSITEKRSIKLRNPEAVRPWQHVLDALAGYLIAGGKLLEGELKGFDSFNFGPAEETVFKVIDIANDFIRKFSAERTFIEFYKSDFIETEYLRLDSLKAGNVLGWKSVMDTRTSIEKTAEWYRSYYSKERSAADLCSQDIKNYLNDYKKLHSK